MSHIDKSGNKDIIHRPTCPNCGQPMVFSFAIPYKEYICVPCGTSEEFCCERDSETTQEREDELKKKWADDLDKLAFEVGGAVCRKCNKSGGNNCKFCKIKKEFKYWKRGAEP